MIDASIQSDAKNAKEREEREEQDVVDEHAGFVRVNYAGRVVSAESFGTPAVSARGLRGLNRVEGRRPSSAVGPQLHAGLLVVL